MCTLLVLMGAGGCAPGASQAAVADLVWGRQGGVGEGRFQKPRGIAIDQQERLYIVDRQARIQVFTTSGEYLHEWQMPLFETGKPTGISIARDGRVLVPDTHYYRVLIFSPMGELLQAIGGQLGAEPGQFEYVTDVAEDSKGFLYISQYGEHDFIQKYTRDGKFVLRWGGHGTEPGQFLRPQSMAVDEQDRIWVADACNHRIQVFDTEGRLLKMWGEEGAAAGQMRYPYGLVFDGDGNLIVCEYGNSRIQRFTREGRSLGCWGRAGHGAGELWNPWALVVDGEGYVHVLDSNNHRVQRVVDSLIR